MHYKPKFIPLPPIHPNAKVQSSIWRRKHPSHCKVKSNLDEYVNDAIAKLKNERYVSKLKY